MAADYPVIKLGVEAAYDRWSRIYDGYDNPMVFMASEVVRRSIAPLVAGGARVFEFGCGTGRNLTALVASGAGEVTGCDLSEGMLDAARRRNPALRLHRHDMTDRAARLTGVEDASAGVVLFCLTLEHVPDLAVPLAEARRIAAPSDAGGGGGRIAIVEIHPFFSLGGGVAHFEEGGERVEMPTYPHQFAGYLNAFASTGLQVERCREWRPRDLDGVELPAKVLKRGPDFPLAVEFTLRHRSAATSPPVRSSRA